jgi:ankyrin repeat protein
MLLSHGCNLEIQNNEGFTAFICAASKGHKDVVETLASHRCNIDAKNKNGWTAVTLAACNGEKDVVDLLITLKCNLDLQSNDGWTGFIYACFYGNISTAISLVEAGCDYSIRHKYSKSGMDYLQEKHPAAVNEVQVPYLHIHTHSSPLHTSHYLICRLQLTQEYARNKKKRTPQLYSRRN